MYWVLVLANGRFNGWVKGPLGYPIERLSDRKTFDVLRFYERLDGIFGISGGSFTKVTELSHVWMDGTALAACYV